MSALASSSASSQERRELTPEDFEAVEAVARLDELGDVNDSLNRIYAYFKNRTDEWKRTFTQHCLFRLFNNFMLVRLSRGKIEGGKCSWADHFFSFWESIASKEFRSKSRNFKAIVNVALTFIRELKRRHPRFTIDTEPDPNDCNFEFPPGIVELMKQSSEGDFTLLCAAIALVKAGTRKAYLVKLPPSQKERAALIALISANVKKRKASVGEEEQTDSWLDIFPRILSTSQGGSNPDGWHTLQIKEHKKSSSNKKPKISSIKPCLDTDTDQTVIASQVLMEVEDGQELENSTQGACLPDLELGASAQISQEQAPVSVPTNWSPNKTLCSGEVVQSAKGKSESTLMRYSRSVNATPRNVKSRQSQSSSVLEDPLPQSKTSTSVNQGGDSNSLNAAIVPISSAIGEIPIVVQQSISSALTCSSSSQSGSSQEPPAAVLPTINDSIHAYLRQMESEFLQNPDFRNFHATMGKAPRPREQTLAEEQLFQLLSSKTNFKTDGLFEESQTILRDCKVVTRFDLMLADRNQIRKIAGLLKKTVVKKFRNLLDRVLVVVNT